MSFLLSHYQSTLERFLVNGYRFCNLDLDLKSKKQFIMVHDVDHDIALTSNFSNIERDLEITATYFLRLHAVKYNMLSNPSIEVAKNLINNNHEVGLHYEPSFFRNKNHEECIRNELDLLSNILNYEVKYFNVHEPSRTQVNLSNILKEKNRCYNSSHLSNFKYISDSSCNWREGCFSEHVGKWDKLLVLTHPFWWYHETPTENY